MRILDLVTQAHGLTENFISQRDAKDKSQFQPLDVFRSKVNSQGSDAPHFRRR